MPDANDQDPTLRNPVEEDMLALLHPAQTLSRFVCRPAKQPIDGQFSEENSLSI